MGYRLSRRLQVARKLYETTHSKREHEKVRSSRELLRLSEREYEFLNLSRGPEMEELPDDWGYRRHELRSQVEQKVSRLPTRFRILADDLELLSWEDYLTPQIWKNDIDDLAFVGRNRGGTSFAPNQYDESPHRPIGIGELFGQMAAHLMIYHQQEEIQDVQADLVWGFIDQLCYEDTLDITPDTKRKYTEELLELVDQRCQQSVSEQKEVRENSAEWYQNSNDHREQLLNKIQTVLEHHNIDIRKAMRYHIMDENIPDEERHDSERTEELIENYLRPKQILNTVIDLELVEESKLLEILHEDANRLRSKSGKGIEMTDILHFVLRLGPISSVEMGDRYQSKWDTPDRRPVAGITEAARDLAGARDVEDFSGRDIWVDRPLLKGDKENWELTVYGKFLAVFIEGDRRGLNSNWISDEEFKEVYDYLGFPEEIFINA